MIINCWKLIYRNNKFLDVILVRYHLYEQTCHSLTRVKDIMRLGTFSICNTDDDWMPLHYNASNAVLKFWLKRSVWETIGQTSQNYSECFCSDTWTVCQVNMMLSYGRITFVWSQSWCNNYIFQVKKLAFSHHLGYEHQ